MKADKFGGAIVVATRFSNLFFFYYLEFFLVMALVKMDVGSQESCMIHIEPL